jgi:hypothetical protein
MSDKRSLLVGVVAGIALSSLAFLTLGAAEPKGPADIPLPVGKSVLVYSTGGGPNLVGQLVAWDRDWLQLKVRNTTFLVNRPQVVYVQHPVPRSTAPPPPPPPER